MLELIKPTNKPVFIKSLEVWFGLLEAIAEYH